MHSRISRSLALSLAALMILGVVALPAAANHVTEAGTFVGVAEVGNTFDANQPCTQTGRGLPVGDGLGLPVLDDREGVFQLTNTFTGLVAGSGQFHVCGHLTKTLGAIGASCAVSKGYDGIGVAAYASGDTIELHDIGWDVTLTGTIPVLGEYRDAGGTGQIVALVQANSGADRCLSGTADRFDVVGVFALAPADDPVTWSDVDDD